MGTLKAFYKWLGQTERVAGNPTLALELPPVLALEANDLSEDEVAQIYAAVMAGRWALRDSPVETLRERALVSVLLHGLREATGIDVYAHRFRHTFATTLLLQGMDSFKAMMLTRHKSV